jgi:hypothetical protein
MSEKIIDVREYSRLKFESKLNPMNICDGAKLGAILHIADALEKLVELKSRPNYANFKGKAGYFERRISELENHKK